MRLYFPNEDAMKQEVQKGLSYPILLFFHGGGWVTDSVENYDRVCSRMAQDTGHIVISVEYRLAPEYRFPIGLEDCYAAARTLYLDLLKEDQDKITIMGDSAGGNLAAAVCLLARARGEFMPKRQILIYPALGNCYTEESPYESVHENGTDYLLTSERMENYLLLYENSKEDRQNPYFSPLMEKDLSNMPDTLILTAEFDPLRDEGEEYGKRLKEAGNYVEMHRIPNAFTDILHWESGSFMCRKVSGIDVNRGFSAPKKERSRKGKGKRRILSCLMTESVIYLKHQMWRRRANNESRIFKVAESWITQLWRFLRQQTKTIPESSVCIVN